MKYSLYLMIMSAVMFTGCAEMQYKYQKFAPQKYQDSFLNLEGESNFSTQERISAFETESVLEEKSVADVEVVPSFEKSAYEVQKNYKVQTSTGGSKLPRDYKISIEKMPLNKFINLVFGEILKVDFTIEPAVVKRSEPVTLKITEGLDKESFENFVFSLLGENYQVDVIVNNNIYEIKQGRSRSELKKYPIFIGKNIDADIADTMEVIQIIPFEYINAKDFMSMTSDIFLSREKKIKELPKMNGLFIADKAGYIKELVEFAKVLDRASIKNHHARLIKLKYIDPKDFKDKVSKLLQASGVPVPSEKSSSGLIMEPISEIETLFVISPKKEWINQLLYWKDKLDTLTQLGEEPKMFVYHTQNRDAAELAPVLSSILGTVSSTVNSDQNRTQSAPQQNRTADRRAAPASSKQNSTAPAAKAAAQPHTATITLDDKRNALIIFATPAKYKEILSILEQVDTVAKQVLIEVMIAEVTLTDALKYGLEWYLQNREGTVNLTPTGNNLNAYGGTNGVLHLDDIGGFYSVLKGALFNVELQALASNSLLNVLSTPKIIVLNNEAATISVGDQIPYVSSKYSDAQDGITESQVTYADTGINLSVKPRVNSANVLSLEISQSVTESAQGSSFADAPLITDRSINTKINLKDGQVALIGGLIREKKNNAVSKVPLLGDLPVIGNAFKTNVNTVDKTELFITIKAHILNDFKNNDEIVSKFRALMEGF